jgi:benzoate-CoA ligase family protein
MQDHMVTVDRTTHPSSIAFAPVFNVAVPFIDRHVQEGRSHQVALRTVSDEVTYGALAENVNRCGNVLRGLGATAGDRVLMVVKDCPEFVYLFWGAIKAGIVPVPVNTLLRAPDYQYMIEDSGCAMMVYSQAYAAEVEPALASAKAQPVALPVEGGDEALQRRLQGASSSLTVVPTRAEDPCFWLYSSGSTGRPKGAVHRHRDMVVTCVYYAEETLGMRADDLCFSAAKLFFAYGLGNAMTFPLWMGATAVLSDQRPSPEMTFELIQRFKPTLYFGVPTLYAAQLRALETTAADLSSLRLCVSAGEALPADIFRRWQERTGLTILDGIGSTELLHIFISNRADDYKPGSSGRPVPGYEARIVDENGDAVADGDVGRLFIKGASSAAYYWNNPEKTAETMQGEWINTGDTYVRDAEGYYVYGGRSDDMLKVGGIWCSPVEVESRLIEHAKVLEAAVVGRADDDQLIKPEAYIVLNDPNDASDALAAELLEHCKTGLARYKYPRWIHFVDELPKTATGKIQRFKLRKSS